MATTAPEVIRRGRGRPPKAPKPENNEAENIQPPEGTPFWDQVASFTVDDWNYLIAYVWRVAPLIDKRNAKEGISIAKYSRPFDMATLKHEHGSGRYRIDLCRIPANGAKQTRILQEYVEILDMDYPPRVPYGDWMNEPENQMWQWAEEPLKMRVIEAQKRLERAERGSVEGPDPNAMFTTVLAGIRELRGDKADNSDLATRLVEVLLTNQAQMTAMNDPARQMATLKTLMAEIAPAQNGEGNAMKEMVGFLRETITDLRTEVRELRNQQQNQPRRSVLEELKDLNEAAGLIGYKRRGEPNPNPGEPKGTDWGGVALQALEKFGPFVPSIVQAIMRGPQNAAMSQTPGQQPAINPQPQVAAPAVPQFDLSQVPEEHRPAMEALQDRLKLVVPKYGQLLSDITPFVRDFFSAKESGLDLRDWFIDRKGKMLWVQLCDDAGPDVLMLLAKMAMPDVMQPPEQVQRFFQEFCSNAPNEEPESDDEGQDEDPGRPEGSAA